MQHYIEGHTEKELLADGQVKTANSLDRIVPEESDNYVMLVAWNFVNYVAFVSMKAPKSVLSGSTI